jgi:dephospho-CoA kinase
MFLNGLPFRLYIGHPIKIMKGNLNKMRWIGLTGGIACGKSTVAALFKSRGIPVIDADETAHLVYRKDSPGYKKIIQAFGLGVLNENGEIDRKKIAGFVFGDPAKLSQLEKIVHPLVQLEVHGKREQLERQGYAFSIYDVPLLFEKKLNSQFDGIIVVGCTEAEQNRRMSKDRGMDRAQITARLTAQVPQELKKKGATWYLENSGSLAELEKTFESVFQKVQSGIR